MAVPRIIQLIAGRSRAVLGILTSSGAADANKVPVTNDDGILDPSLIGAATTGEGVPLLTLSDGTIDPSVLPTGVGPDIKHLPASEALAAGDIVNIWNDAGIAKARKADATAEGKEAHGFVKAGAALNATAAVYFEGRISGLDSLTPGARMFLSAATAGAATATPPAAAGNVVQHIGTAVSATEIDFEKGEPVTLA